MEPTLKVGVIPTILITRAITQKHCTLYLYISSVLFFKHTFYVATCSEYDDQEAAQAKRALSADCRDFIRRQSRTNLFHTTVVADAEFNSPKPGEDTEMPDVPAMESAKDSPSSEDSHQPPPASAIPQFQTFGADPSTYDDPTIYHLRDILPDMDEQEKKDILGVAVYPHDDLHDLTPGTPPDRDFTNAKPQHQVSATAFATYLEPFVRDITEEDLAFLRERVSNS